jgi:CubicO group peptidase (beta-lactamase class C family)
MFSRTVRTWPVIFAKLSVMKIKTLIRILVCLLLFCCQQVTAQPGSLPRGIPEEEGVSSAGILRFVEAAEKSKNELHSFVILRHGKIIAEGWWNPYQPKFRSTIYSASKTFTATAVGLAIAEGKLKLTDKVISFFPHELPDSVSANLAALTVEDVLIMSDGQSPESTPLAANYKDWVRAFLSAPIVNKPGTVFLYNSLGTFMLSAIVQKVTGQKLVDYLKPRLFEPLGIQGIDWEENLMGQNTGGWGLSIKTEDMAKFGQLYLQKGKWNGTQILSEAWVTEATTTKIIQHPDLPQAKKDTSDWEQGYGYQIWRSRHNAYRGDGAYGQNIVVLPELDAVVAIQAETSDLQNELNLVWDYILPAFKKSKLPANEKDQYALQAKLATLSIVAQTGSASALVANKNFNKYFVLQPNENNISNISIQIQDSICHLTMNAAGENYNFYYGAGFWKPGQTNKPGPSLFFNAKENFALESPYKVESSFFWSDDQTLVMKMRYIETPHTEITTCHFDGNNITVDIARSFDFGSKKSVMNGVVK